MTYAGQPLYRFVFDESSDEIEGANLFDPVTSPPGTWYLVDPSRGLPATGQAQVQLETAPVGGTGPDETVLAATMNNDFSLFPDASFPVYTSSADSGHTASARESVLPPTGHRFSPQAARKPGPASTSTPSGSSSGPTAPTR